MHHLHDNPGLLWLTGYCHSPIERFLVMNLTGTEHGLLLGIDISASSIILVELTPFEVGYSL